MARVRELHVPGARPLPTAAPDEAFNQVHGIKQRLSADGEGAMAALDGSGYGGSGSSQPSRKDMYATTTEAALRGESTIDVRPGVLPEGVSNDTKFGIENPKPEGEGGNWNPIMQGQAKFAEESLQRAAEREQEEGFSATQRLSVSTRRVTGKGQRPGVLRTGLPDGAVAGVAEKRDYEWPTHINPSTHQYGSATGVDKESAGEVLASYETFSGDSKKPANRAPPLDRVNVMYGKGNTVQEVSASDTLVWPAGVSEEEVKRRVAAQRAQNGGAERSANPFLARSLNPRPSETATRPRVTLETEALPPLTTGGVETATSRSVSAVSLAAELRPERHYTQPQVQDPDTVKQAASADINMRQMKSGWYSAAKPTPGYAAGGEARLSTDLRKVQENSATTWDEPHTKEQMDELLESSGLARKVAAGIIEEAWEQCQVNGKCTPRVLNERIVELRLAADPDGSGDSAGHVRIQ